MVKQLDKLMRREGFSPIARFAVPLEKERLDSVLLAPYDLLHAGGGFLQLFDG